MAALGTHSNLELPINETQPLPRILFDIFDTPTIRPHNIALQSLFNIVAESRPDNMNIVMAQRNTPSPQRQAPTSGFEVLGDMYLLEEEMFRWYTPECSYPVQIGQIFRLKYQVLGKLGFGSLSTAWLCRDLM